MVLWGPRNLPQCRPRYFGLSLPVVAIVGSPIVAVVI